VTQREKMSSSNHLLPHALSPNGQPLEVTWLRSILHNKNITSFETINHISGAHSSTMRLELKYEDNNTNDDDKHPKYIYWKRIVIRDLPMKASYKLVRDVNSYRTEALFYETISKELNKREIVVPNCLHLHKKVVTDDLVQSEFLIILEDLGLSGFKQRHIHFSKQDVFNCIDYIAAIHGLYWNKLDTSQIPQSGTYWTYDKRPENESQTIPAKWRSFCDRFSQVSDLFNQSNIQNIGDRLLKWLPWLSEQLNNISGTTLVHGDFKSANIFFNDSQVASIDWQWSGPGKGISDVMYLVLGTYNMDLGHNDYALETELLTHYCNQLKHHNQIEYNVPDALRHFKIATLDFSRIIFAYFFDGQTPQSIEACASDQGELTHTSSIPHLIDLIRYIDQLLSELENNNDFI
jgi:aminoglycoside/choline kinase family phosphotransferase